MANNKQATWGGRFTEPPADRMVRFGESVSFDQRLAQFDIKGSRAHASMLAHTGIISQEEANQIREGLSNIESQIQAGNFPWDPALEDVHMNIEQALTRDVPAAAKLHSARSRNDQIATDMRLFFKDALNEINEALRRAMLAIVEKAIECEDVYIPGYTHLQRAQPVSMAHHLHAYVEMLGRDLERSREIFNRANVCPLGCGAIAGSTLPIDREFVARELGFVDEQGNPRVSYNSMDTVADRDLFIEFANLGAMIGIHLSRIAEDLILWNSTEFGYVYLPDAYTTGSSLMPQKKNPDALELIRGKCGRLCGHVTALHTMVKGLPLTYNRDLQEDKPPVFDTLDTTRDCLLILEGTMSGIKPNRDTCAAAVNDPLLLATDLVDYLVLKGKPFRQAHHVVGALVALAESRHCALNELPNDAVREIDPLLEDDWASVFNLQTAMSQRNKPGMPGPKMVHDQLANWKSSLT